MKEQATIKDVQLLQANFKEGEIITIEPNSAYPDGYKCRILKITNEGIIELRLIDVYPCM